MAAGVIDVFKFTDIDDFGTCFWNLTLFIGPLGIFGMIGTGYFLSSLLFNIIAYKLLPKVFKWLITFLFSWLSDLLPTKILFTFS